MRTAIACVGLLALGVGVCAQDVPVNVFVNGKPQKYDPPALVRDGVTYVPLRQGAVSLGLSVEWMAELNAAQVCDSVSCILIPKNEGIIINGRLMLPLRKMGEFMGARVTWDGARRAVLIQSGPGIGR